jgi:hypothetical protein
MHTTNSYSPGWRKNLVRDDPTLGPTMTVISAFSSQIGFEIPLISFEARSDYGLLRQRLQQERDIKEHEERVEYVKGLFRDTAHYIMSAFSHPTPSPQRKHATPPSSPIRTPSLRHRSSGNDLMTVSRLVRRHQRQGI